eukprot:s466_g4.t1
MHHLDLQEWSDKPWSLQPCDRTDDEYHNQHRDALSALRAQPDGLRQFEPLDQQPDFVQDLHPLWQAEAQIEAWEEGPTHYVVSWFLHGQYQFSCRQSRTLRLDAAYDHWNQQLLDLWRDMIEPARPIEIYLVRPRPLQTYEYNLGHVIIIQLPPDDHSGILAVVDDERYYTLVTRRFATFSPMILGWDEWPNVLDLTGLHLRRPRDHFHGNDMVPYPDARIVQHGNLLRIFLHVEREFPLSYPRRRTVEQVAHTPRPGLTDDEADDELFLTQTNVRPVGDHWFLHEHKPITLKDQ